MLTEIARERGFELLLTETNEEFTAENLAKYELVFFLNTSGDVLDAVEEQALEAWMVGKNGGFAGTYRAVDTEPNWGFYKELTGEYYDGNSPCCVPLDIEWHPSVSEFAVVKGLPSPWRFQDLWLLFGEYPAWASRPGFRVLGTILLDGRAQPVSFVREWGNFRSFYTVLGHQAATFEDADVKRHVTAGILWTVRREHLLD
jgi:type 1 glutamine amidotransferase